MTMENLATKSGPYVGDGANRTFSFGFHVSDAAHLRVTHRDVNGDETLLVEGTHYSVNPGSVNNVDGGTITYPKDAGNPALSATEKLVLSRHVPIIQSTNLRNQGAWNPEVVESAFDEIYKILLEQDEEMGRALIAAISDVDYDLDSLIADIAAAAGFATAAQAAQAAAEAAQAAAEAAAASVTIGGTITLNGPATYNVTGSDQNKLLAVDTSGGNVTVNLPQISVAGEPFVFSVKKTTGDSNTVTVHPYSGDEIDEDIVDVVIGSLNEAMTFQADEDAAPDNWITIAIGLVIGDIIVDSFIAGTDYTAGSAKTLTLSVAPAKEEDVLVFFDGHAQHHSGFTVSGTTLTFDDAIPLGVAEVEVRMGQEFPVGVPGSSTVGINQIIQTEVAGLDVDNTWTKRQGGQEQTLTDGATIDWDTSNSNYAKVTLGGNRTVNAPTSLKVGTYVLRVIQDATGGRTLTWNAAFQWAGGTAPTLATAANAEDIISLYCDGTNLHGALGIGDSQ